MSSVQSIESDGVKVSSNEPDGMTVSSNEPDSEKISGNEPDGEKISSNEPDGVKISSNEPDGVKISSNEPDAVKISNEPEKVKVSSLPKSRKRNFGVTDLENSELLKYARKNPPSGYQDTNFEESEYYFENGLRKVYPYFFTFSTFCKARWVEKPLIDVFTSEFRALSNEQYREKILAGHIMVNGVKVSPEYELSNNDLITNKVHRHEVAVIAAPIKIIHSEDDLIVVDKPPSIPVHPCGRFRHNSLLFILAEEHGLKNLHTIHRIDRHTSGIVILCKTLKKAQELDKQVRSHELVKEYLCRVEGLFPDGIVTCDKPVETLSPKIGVCVVASEGKECFTQFERVSYNGKSSVVRCLPKTGRMHQIRVHLQYLGYPIINDHIYNSDVFGPLKGKGGDMRKSKEQLLSDLMKVHNIENWLNPDCQEGDNEKNLTALKILEHNMEVEDYKSLEEKYKKDDSKFTKDPSCQYCQKSYRNPEPKDLMIFLHAYRYKGDSWEFKTELPVWAQEEWSDM